MRITFALMVLLLSSSLSSQEIARFTVTPAEGAGISSVAVPLDGIDFNTDSHRIALYRKGSSGMSEVPCQIERGSTALLWFMFDNRQGTSEYIIRREPEEDVSKGSLSAEKTQQATSIIRNGNPVLTYNHAEVLPPEGVDRIFRRSGFIHPLWSPGGEILTRIQPADHYHHYGIWNPWTRTVIDGRYVDFWNLGGGQGRVRSAGYLGVVEGPVYAGFRVRHEHVAYLEEASETIAINELWDVRVWDTGVEGVSVVDLTTTLNTPLENGILFEAYRYGGGLGFRATEKWHGDNCTVLTSEGRTRDETDGTGARWVIIEGESSAKVGRSGVILLSHPSNRMHPEPVRMWDTSANRGRENMFFNFCPIRHTDWMIEPGKDYALRYRMVVFDGQVTPEEAEMFWRSFAKSPVVKF